jgi:hypothetical protein
MLRKIMRPLVQAASSGLSCSRLDPHRSQPLLSRAADPEPMTDFAESLLCQDTARRNQKDRLHHMLVYTLHEYEEGPTAKSTDDRPAKCPIVDMNGTVSVRQIGIAC